MKASEFWEPTEGKAATFEEAADLISSITAIKDGRLFAWRGVPDARWGLYSSLYRRLRWSRLAGSPPPTEKDLCDAEQQVIAEAQRWGLHSGERGRLSMFEFLATLQHYGAPTRFIDVTFNPYAALFFACESDGHVKRDARVFAIEVTGRLLNGNKDESFAAWERSDTLPWLDADEARKAEWSHYSYVWKPAGFDRRIAAQHGGFLLGGVPVSRAGAYKKATGGYWSIAEVRRATSVALQPYVIDRKKGRPPLKGSAVYSFRVPASGKAEVLASLKRTFHLDHATIYPDFPGFAAHGTPWMPTKKP